jgi:hypothetical protein
MVRFAGIEGSTGSGTYAAGLVTATAAGRVVAAGCCANNLSCVQNMLTNSKHILMI